jgi:hypothetical protein
MVDVAQIGSGSTLSHVVCTRRWEAADQTGRSCSVTRLALSASLFVELEGFLHHVDDALHPLDDVIGFGRVGHQLLAGAGDDV